MAIDSASKRKSAAGVPFLPLGVGVTPDASKPVEWRQQAGWGYSGIAPATPEIVAETPGGIFRANESGRVFKATETGRVFNATESGRVFRCTDNGNTPMTQLTLISGETRAYVWEFGPRREMEAGETISSPSIPAVSGVTIGSPAVLTAAFDGVAIGAGVKATVTSSTAGTYTITCQVTTSGGATLKEKGSLIVT